MTLLSNLRVLDFGRYIAAPYCGHILGRLGAEVIRIERPGGAEDRFLVPVSKQGDGAMYIQLNGNKKCLTLDITSDQGKEIVKQLVASADIVIANYPPFAMKALGLDYESLTAVNPEIILVANTAFGSTSKFKNRVGFDGIAQAISGANYYSGLADMPIRCTVNYIDFSTAISAALGTMIAIMAKERTGKGQVVETSLLGTALTLNNSMLIEQAVLRPFRQPKGNRGQLAGPADLFKTKDGHVVILVAGPYMFKRWCKMIGREDLLDDPKFADDTLRGNNNDELCEIMNAWSGQMTNEEVLEWCEKSKLPAGPVLDFQGALDSELVQSLDHLQSVNYPGTETAPPIGGLTFGLSETNLEAFTRAPLIGEHNQEILSGLGLSTAEIDELEVNNLI